MAAMRGGYRPAPPRSMPWPPGQVRESKRRSAAKVAGVEHASREWPAKNAAAQPTRNASEGGQVRGSHHRARASRRASTGLRRRPSRPTTAAAAVLRGRGETAGKAGNGEGREADTPAIRRRHRLVQRPEQQRQRSGQQQRHQDVGHREMRFAHVQDRDGEKCGRQQPGGDRRSRGERDETAPRSSSVPASAHHPPGQQDISDAVTAACPNTAVTAAVQAANIAAKR